MNPLRKLMIIPADRRKMLLEALVIVTLFESLLRVVKMQRIARLVDSAGKRHRVQTSNLSAAEIANTVCRASRHSPARPMCLAQALATAYMLRERGVNAELKIGVAKDLAGKLQAHAWIERQGVILIGDQRDMYRFRTIYSKAWSASNI